MSDTIRRRIVGRTVGWPMRNLNRLSALRAKTESTQGRYSDGGGLYLQVSGSGTRSWLFRFERDGRGTPDGARPRA
jgi:hypothetical protein